MVNRSLSRACGVLLLATSVGGSALSAPQVVMSLAGDGMLNGGTLLDEEIAVVATDGTSRKLLSSQTLAFYLGDLDGDGVQDAPNDIDAFDIHAVPAGQPAIAGLYFSLLSDQSGIADGDVVRFAPENTPPLEVVFSESFLVAAVQATDGNIDVDAFAIDATGGLYFSLAEDEATGPSNVILEDDAILYLPAAGTVAQVMYDGVAVEQMVQNALGTTSSIGDLKGLDLFGSQILFTVQSPSAHDATIFSTASGGSIHQGMVEASLGFGNQVEADGLAVMEGPAFPSIEIDFPVTPEGSPVNVFMSGLEPGQPFLLWLSGNSLPAGSGIQAGGFSAFVLDPLDPIFLVAAQNASLLMGAAGPDGRGVISGTAPSSAGAPVDLSLQVLDAAGRLSGPVLLELNQ